MSRLLGLAFAAPLLFALSGPAFSQAATQGAIEDLTKAIIDLRATIEKHSKKPPAQFDFGESGVGTQTCPIGGTCNVPRDFCKSIGYANGRITAQRQVVNAISISRVVCWD